MASPLSQASPGSASTPPSGKRHTWLQKKGISLHSIQRSIEKAKQQQDDIKAKREENRAKIKALVEEMEPGEFLDPEMEKLREKSDARTQGRPATCLQTGTGAGLKSNKREPGGMILRRDPTAQEKLHMVS